MKTEQGSIVGSTVNSTVRVSWIVGSKVNEASYQHGYTPKEAKIRCSENCENKVKQK